MVISAQLAGMTALNANRKNQNNLKKDLEQLSSGFRINRSADDASGLAMSEKMRAQIKSLDVSVENCENGISLLQTAEGYIAEMQNMASRVIELAMKSANGTLEMKENENFGNTDTDRQALQDEVNQICKEIDRVAETANFNRIPLFNGTETTTTEMQDIIKTTKHITVENPMPSFISMTNGGFLSDVFETTADPSPNSYPSIGEHSAGIVDFSSVNAANYKQLAGTGFYTTCFTCDNHYSIQFVDSSLDPANPAYGTDGMKNVGSSEYLFQVDLQKIDSTKSIPEQLIARILSVTGNSSFHSDSKTHADFGSDPTGHYTWFLGEKDNVGNATGKLIIYDERSQFSHDDDYGKFANGVVTDSTVETEIIGQQEVVTKHYSPTKTITLQIGETSLPSDKLDIIMKDLHTDQILKNLSSAVQQGSANDHDQYTMNISRQSSAAVAADEMKQVNNALSAFRGTLGAQYNRLERAVLTNQNAGENVTAAKSRIKDTDQAKTVTDFVRSNILNQASVAMIHKSNQAQTDLLRMLAITN